MSDVIVNMASEYFMESEPGQQLKRAIAIIENLQKNLYALAVDDSGEKLTEIKIGTILTFGILRKISCGKMPQEFTREDWMEIAKEVSNIAILMDGQQYSVYIFSLYSDYIDFSAEGIRGLASDTTVESIKNLAADLRAYANQLAAGEISEVTYTEQCLWTSLEAMIKLLSASLSAVMGEELSELAQAAAVFAFEYGRCKLYQKENQILAGYLENQKMLDEELQQKLEAYTVEMQAYADEFNRLVDAAFAPEFRDSLMGSVQLARAAGVSENEILDSLDKVDDFFM